MWACTPATFLLTVIFDLTIAIEVGLLLAVVLFYPPDIRNPTTSVFQDEVEAASYVEGGAETDKLSLPKRWKGTK